jgi:Uma2 family endonuclease
MEAKRRHEFREWVDETMKAEFINGEIIVHSPVKKKHWQTSDFLSTLLSVYTKLKNLGAIGVEKVMIALTRNDYEPDIVFFKEEKAKKFEKNQMFFPAPDFVVEILSNKTASKDRGIKKQDYAAHGVREYWIIDAEKQQIEQFFLLEETDKVYFEPYLFAIDDEIESKVITGFKIPVRAVFEKDANAETLKSFFVS